MTVYHCAALREVSRRRLDLAFSWLLCVSLQEEVNPRKKKRKKKKRKKKRKRKKRKKMKKKWREMLVCGY